MIEKLTQISNISSIDQSLQNNITGFDNLTFDNSSIGEGQFGTVHKVLNIDGKIKHGLSVKICRGIESREHALKTISLLHNRIGSKLTKIQNSIYDEVPSLMGLPFIICDASLTTTGEECTAMLMFDLSHKGYTDYGDDDYGSNYLSSLPLNEKAYLAYEITKGIDFLHSINFIHSDLDPHSIYIDKTKCRIALIDFDSGYIYDKQMKPTTIGKISHYVGGLFRNTISNIGTSSLLTSADRLAEEEWKLTNLIFELMVGVVPYFFLVDADDSTKKAYLKENKWPQVNPESELFNSNNKQSHQGVLDFLDFLNESGVDDLVSSFKTVFNKGYTDYRRRLNANGWKNLLWQLNMDFENRPIVSSFNSSKSQVRRADEEVDFRWSTKMYSQVIIKDEINSLSNGKSLSFSDSSLVTIKVVNDFGATEDTIEIEAVKVEPQIMKFNADKNIRDNEDPIQLNWVCKNVTKVTLSNHEQDILDVDSLFIEPSEKTKYILTAEGYFGELTSKSVEVDIVRPEIETFYSEVNLEHGIENVDLIWKTKNANSVSIYPRIGQVVDVDGIYHIPIKNETEFTIEAHGLFTKATKTISARSFPLPVVKELLAPAPVFDFTINANLAKIDFKDRIEIPTILKEVNIPSVQFTQIEPIEVMDLKRPNFKDENLMVMPKKSVSLIDIFEKIKIIVDDKLSRIIEKNNE